MKKIRSLGFMILIMSVLYGCSNDEKKVRLAIQSHLEIVKKQEIDKVLEMLDQNALNYMNVLWSVYKSEDVKRIKSYLEDTDYPVLEVEWIKKLYQVCLAPLLNQRRRIFSW